MKNILRNDWLIARVMNAICEKDNRIHKVEVCIVRDGKTVLYTRPVSEIILLLSKWIEDFVKFQNVAHVNSCRILNFKLRKLDAIRQFPVETYGYIFSSCFIQVLNFVPEQKFYLHK